MHCIFFCFLTFFFLSPNYPWQHLMNGNIIIYSSFCSFLLPWANNATNGTFSSSVLTLCCSVPQQQWHHQRSHFCQTVPECVAVTGHQTLVSDIIHQGLEFVASDTGFVQTAVHPSSLFIILIGWCIFTVHFKDWSSLLTKCHFKWKCWQSNTGQRIISFFNVMHQACHFMHFVNQTMVNLWTTCFASYSMRNTGPLWNQ